MTEVEKKIEAEVKNVGYVCVIPEDGVIRFDLVNLDEDGQIPLEALQKRVGGWVELIYCGAYVSQEMVDRNIDIFINEEGKLNSLAYNPRATRLTNLALWGDAIVGPAVLCKRDEEGNSLPLTEEDKEFLCRLVV
jgi:hypothetical protein